MRLDVEYIRNVKPGDVFVGNVNPSAPTRPVQPVAHGMTVHHVISEAVEGERFPQWVLVFDPNPRSMMRSAPRPAISQVMVIR